MLFITSKFADQSKDQTDTVFSGIHSRFFLKHKIPLIKMGFKIPFYQSHKKRSSDRNFLVHFYTHFCQIGGVLFSHLCSFFSEN